MKLEMAALVGTLCLASAGALADERKEDRTEAIRTKLMGIWVAQDGGKTPAGSTFEVTKEGKFRSVIKVSDTTIIHEGTYKLDGDTITATHKRKDGSQKVRVLKILKLTDEDLTVSDDDEKTTLKKKKSE